MEPKDPRFLRVRIKGEPFIAAGPAGRLIGYSNLSTAAMLALFRIIDGTYHDDSHVVVYPGKWLTLKIIRDKTQVPKTGHVQNLSVEELYDFMKWSLSKDDKCGEYWLGDELLSRHNPTGGLSFLDRQIAKKGGY